VLCRNVNAVGKKAAGLTGETEEGTFWDEEEAQGGETRHPSAAPTGVSAQVLLRLLDLNDFF